MSSVKCPECGLTNWATQENCKRCGFGLQADAGSRFVPPAPPADSFFDASANFPPPEFLADEPANDGEPQWSSPNFEAQANRAPSQPPANPYQKPNNYQTSNQPPPNYQYQNRQTNYQSHQPANLKSGLAIASMVLGIFGVVTSIILIGIPFALVGLVLGIIALVKANKQPNVYGGKGFAIAGIATGSLIVLVFPIIAAIAIPNLLAARRAANEASAISGLRTLSGAEAVHMATAGGKNCADLSTLGAEKLIDGTLSAGERNGYRFTVTNVATSGGGCELRATPVSSSTGTRSFYSSTAEGVVRVNKSGAPAGQNDLPIQ